MVPWKVSSMVSIHAPTQGATCKDHGMFLKDFVFQSTLPHRERPRPLPRSGWQPCGFNPRSHTGSDPGFPCSHYMTVCFNPRSHTGSDYSCNRLPSLLCRFQSTLPHRERHNQLLCCAGAKQVSIHAPTQGATQ